MKRFEGKDDLIISDFENLIIHKKRGLENVRVVHNKKVGEFFIRRKEHLLKSEIEILESVLNILKK